MLCVSILARTVVASTNVTVAVVEQPPWIYVTELPGQPPFFSGIVVDLITTITLQANALCANTQDLACGLNVQYKQYPSWGEELPNGTWTGAIGDMFAGNVQVVPSLPFMQSWTDLGVLFSPPWSQSTLAFVTKQVIVERGIDFFLAPFEAKLWYLTFGSFAIVAVVIALMDRFRGQTYASLEARAAASALEKGHRDAGGHGDAHGDSHGDSGVPPPIPFRDAVFRSALALVGLAAVPPPSHAQRLAHLSAFVLFFFIIRTCVSIRRLRAITITGAAGCAFETN